MVTEFEPRIDFKRLLADVLECGQLSRGALAMHANIPRSSLFNYENGVTPLHPVGERLIEIWCESFGMTRDKLPRCAEPRMPKPSHITRHSLEKVRGID